jgi:TPR repeat protein
MPKMKKMLLTSVVAIAMLMGSVSGALADFEAGKKAYERNDYDIALKEFMKAAEQKNADALFIIADMYRFGLGVKKNKVTAIKFYERAYLAGKKNAAWELAGMYINIDVEKSVEWKRKAELDIEAAGAADYFENGSDAVEKKDYATAVVEFRKGAENGDENSIAEVIWFLLTRSKEANVAEEKGYIEAIKWAQKLNTMGVETRASNILLGAAEAYFDGDEEFDVPNGYLKATRLIRDLIEITNPLSDAERERVIGISLQGLDKIVGENSGTPKEKLAIVDLMHHPIIAANSKVQLRLGEIYEEGLAGMKADYVQAHMWYSIAASSGSSEGKFKRKSIEASMRPTQITKSQEMAHEWKQKHSQ